MFIRADVLQIEKLHYRAITFEEKYFSTNRLLQMEEHACTDSRLETI